MKGTECTIYLFLHPMYKPKIEILSVNGTVL